MAFWKKKLRNSAAEPAGFEAFSPAIYREFNLDLQQLNEDELRAHFAACRHEPRIFGPTTSTAEFLSMRWLRGAGLEVGAGPYPMRMFGAANTLRADVDIGLQHRGERLDVRVSLDDPDFPAMFETPFDFAVASHVLEHCDSFIRAIENLLLALRPGGIAYIVLPDIEYLGDRNWIPDFDFAHHAEEYKNALLYSHLHDAAYSAARLDGIASPDPFDDLLPEYQEMIKAGKIGTDFRFLHHKHNYKFGGWLEMIGEAQKFLDGQFEILEARYGHERKDCHFVLRRLTP